MFKHSGNVQPLSGSGILSWRVVFTHIVNPEVQLSIPRVGQQSRLLVT